MAKELDLQQVEFCEAYLQGLISEKGVNATEAYLKAYPASSRDSASVSASRLLTNARIKDYIAGRVAQLTMSTSEALLRLADISRTATNVNDRIRALDLILKTQGVYITRQDITTNGEKISWTQLIENKGEAAKFGGVVLDK